MPCQFDATVQCPGEVLLEFTMPAMETKSENNDHEFWRYRAKRRRVQRQGTHLTLKGFLNRRANAKWKQWAIDSRLYITITRIVPSARNFMRDDDNLNGCTKAIRDEIAKTLGQADSMTTGSGKKKAISRLVFDVQQEKGEEFAVRVQIARLHEYRQ